MQHWPLHSGFPSLFPVTKPVYTLENWKQSLTPDTTISVKYAFFFLSLFRVNFLTRTIKHFSWKASKLKWMSLTTQKYKQNYLIDLVNSWALGHQICLPQSPCHQISPCFLDPMKQILPLQTLVSLSCWAFCCSVRIVSLISVYVAWH